MSIWSIGVLAAKSIVLEDPEGQSHFLGLADDAETPAAYLILSRVREYDEQDHALGMATYHIEFSGQGMSGYGGIREARLSKGRLDLQFDEKGMEFLGGLESLTVGFSEDQVTFKMLKKVLSDIFGGSDCAFRVAV